MKKYYLHDGSTQQGPFDIEDLKLKNISGQTSIWYQGLDNWTTAEKIDELKSIFTSVPPPFSAVPPAFETSTPPTISNPTIAQQQTYYQPVKQKSKVWRYVFILVGLIGLGGLGLFIYDQMNEGGRGAYGSSTETYQDKVMTVEEIEKSQPIKFLTADGNYNENFWGDKLKVHGTITNKATVATFKDAVVRVTYYSKTKTALGTNDYTIYETFPPTSSKRFELKIEKYKNVNSIGLEVIDATND